MIETVNCCFEIWIFMLGEREGGMFCHLGYACDMSEVSES